MRRWPLLAHKFGRARRMQRIAPFMAVAGLVLGLTVGVRPASAHVQIDVGNGRYTMEIGFRDEPTYVGQPNAIYLHVEEYATGGTKPVDGLASTLKAEVSKDNQTYEPPLVPMGDGSYEARFVPTETGDYTFHITGTIGDAPVDESVTSGPQTFDSVQPLTTIEFPRARPDPAVSAAQSAQSEASTARLFGIAGIAVGALGLIVAVIALTRSGRTAAAPAPAADVETTGKLIR
jgi:hypothetical protein